MRLLAQLLKYKLDKKLSVFSFKSWIKRVCQQSLKLDFDFFRYLKAAVYWYLHFVQRLLFPIGFNLLQFEPLNQSQSKNGTSWIPIGPFFGNVTSVDQVMFWDRVSRATSNLNRIDWNYSRTYYSCFRENTRLSIIGSKSNCHMPSSAKLVNFALPTLHL